MLVLDCVFDLDILYLVYFLANGVLKSDRVEEALKKVDRKNYTKLNPFMDSPQPIGKDY